MNTTPADEKLALWLEDELDGPALAEIDAWAESNPEWLQHRTAAREVKALIRPVIPAVEEPPYAEFFNARIAREIEVNRSVEAVTPEVIPSAPVRMWRWFLPATAVAGMALCFWAGTRIAPPGASGLADAPPTPPQMSAPMLTPVLYTPERGVKAAYFSSAPADAMVIVLDGVAALPDSFELPETAERPNDDGAATADILLPAP